MSILLNKNGNIEYSITNLLMRFPTGYRRKFYYVDLKLVLDSFRIYPSGAAAVLGQSTLINFIFVVTTDTSNILFLEKTLFLI